MLTIGICDDDNDHINSFSDLLSDVMKNIADYNLKIYESADEVKADILSGSYNVNLLFLDIIMEKGNGMKLAAYIYEHKIDTDIIFVTGTPEYVFESYSYRAFTYLLKPVSGERLNKELIRYFDETGTNTRNINISFDGNSYRIPIRSIRYIESKQRVVFIHCDNNEYKTYKKLDDLEETLRDSGFARCHQSYLVPKSRVLKYDTTSVTLENTTLNLTRKYKESFEKAMENKARSQMSQKSIMTSDDIYCGLVCISGPYTGVMIRIKPDIDVTIGRDNTVSDLIINLPEISRKHMIISFDPRQGYTLTDLSKNGTYVMDLKHEKEPERLSPESATLLPRGTAISLGRKDNIFRLL